MLELNQHEIFILKTPYLFEYLSRSGTFGTRACQRKSRGVYGQLGGELLETETMNCSRGRDDNILLQLRLAPTTTTATEMSALDDVTTPFWFTNLGHDERSFKTTRYGYVG